MAEREDWERALDDGERLRNALARLTARGHRVFADLLERQGGAHEVQVPDPVVIAKSFFHLAAKLMAEPARLAAAQAELWRSYGRLFEATTKRLKGEAAEPLVRPARDDRRFSDAAWTEDAVFDFLKQSYLLTAEWVQALVRTADGLDADDARKVNFYTRRLLNAFSPSNFVATNPKVLKATQDSKGANLLKGLERLLEDLEEGKGRLRISMTDASAFELGRNLAVTPGAVVFQNELMQLIQYRPSTETVLRTPLLVIPPWINKYYVLDLQPKNSFIKWALDQGHTVFVVSWVNPDARLAGKRFDDYMLEGPLAALDGVAKATGEARANVVGYCIGGTLLACTLAYLAAKGEDRVASASFFTAMVDFREAGELAVFIDDEQLRLLEDHMREKGFLEGRHMATVFNLMRDNDLIWSFVVNNYLMGREPHAFDLLYWNADSTRMPAMMHGFYLRKLYLENRLIEPGGIALDSVPIDLARIRVPAYVLATREDHIAPWASTFQATRLYKGPVRFALAASGHIAGVINPPAAGKYGYWTNRDTRGSPEQWLAGAALSPGSWWPDWDSWVKANGGGDRVPARAVGGGVLPEIEDAPGSYVRVRAVE